MLDWNDLRYFLAVARDGSTLAAAQSAAGQPDHRRTADRRARGGARRPALREAPGRLRADARRRRTCSSAAEQVETRPQRLRRSRRGPSRDVSGTVQDHHRGNLCDHLARAVAARAARTPSRNHDRARHSRRRSAISARAKPTSRCAAPRATSRPRGLVGRQLCDRRLDALLQPRLCRPARRPDDPRTSSRSTRSSAAAAAICAIHYQRWLQAARPRRPGRDAPRDIGAACCRPSARASASPSCPCIVADADPDLVRCLPPRGDHGRVAVAVHARARPPHAARPRRDRFPLRAAQPPRPQLEAKRTPKPPDYSTVTVFARLRGWSTSVPLSTATW